MEKLKSAFSLRWYEEKAQKRMLKTLLKTC
nr:MAG TPA: hypothetical protein [Microviridae sp.]